MPTRSSRRHNHHHHRHRRQGRLNLSSTITAAMIGEKKISPLEFRQTFFSDSQLNQPRVRIMNMCREVRHAAALLMQSLHSLRALDDGIVSAITGHTVPPGKYPKTCHDGWGFPGAVPLVPFGSHRTFSFSTRKKNTKDSIFSSFWVPFSRSPTFTSDGHVSLVDMQVAVHLASVSFRFAWTRR